MDWNNKRQYVQGDLRRAVRYALLPFVCCDGRTRWLTPVQVLERYQRGVGWFTVCLEGDVREIGLPLRVFPRFTLTPKRVSSVVLSTLKDVPLCSLFLFAASLLGLVFLGIANVAVPTWPLASTAFQSFVRVENWVLFPIFALLLLLADQRNTARRCSHVTVNDILVEEDVHRRERMLNQVGLDRFMRFAPATVIDQDLDGSGMPRALLRVRFDQEPLAVVQVKCPTTGLIHFLRVPPDTRTCRQAVARGFGLPEREYQPWVET